MSQDLCEEMSEMMVLMSFAPNVLSMMTLEFPRQSGKP